MSSKIPLEQLLAQLGLPSDLTGGAASKAINGLLGSLGGGAPGGLGGIITGGS